VRALKCGGENGVRGVFIATFIIIIIVIAILLLIVIVPLWEQDLDT
jgi:competence protein ComGC